MNLRRINKLRIKHRSFFLVILFFSTFPFLSLKHTLSQSYTFTDKDCLSCHGKPEIYQITSEGKLRSIYVNPEEWSQDIHYKSKMICVDCHSNANPYLHFREGFIDVNCARCHPEEEEEYQKNVHLTFTAPSGNKELPLCYHCHTRHHILRHDDPSSSINEKNVGKTCGNCHAEVMVKGILKGSSLGKFSGHRKGDLSEKFEMRVCINCHYEDSAHGSKRVYKDFCSRCHNVRSKASFVLGPTHLDSKKWKGLNYMDSSLVLLLLLGTCFFIGYKSRRGILKGVKACNESMKREKEV